VSGAKEHDQLLLRQGDAQVVLDPAHGGAVREFRSRGQHVLRPTAGAAATDPFEFACFPLVPYANRIAGGRFTSGAHTVQLRRNWDADPHPLHGQGWRAAWQVAEAATSEARLQFEGGGDEWPWRYRAEQHFRLAAGSLTIGLSIENRDRSPMPAMLGLHPYFADPGHALLEAQTPRTWTTDEAALPVSEVPTPGAWSFSPARRVGALALDHCFVGWDGTAVLRWPGCTTTLRATNCHCLHVYVPAAGDFFCLEPQTAATGAINRGEATLVQPGELLAMRLSFNVGVQ
jgi:aldose 1-epimerase